MPFSVLGRRYEIVGVYDWADARFLPVQFDVLMVCRRVVASLEQARVVWGEAEERLGVKLGRMECWLELERLWRVAMGKEGGPRVMTTT